MFTAAERSTVRHGLVEAARADPRITAAALVGSLAAGREDQWSDIDIALRLAPTLTPVDVIDSWTSTVYDVHGAIAHLDLWSGPTLFRVFLLRNSLQVDLSLWPNDEFAQSDGPFRLVFGQANEPVPDAEAATSRALHIGMAWLHALHARSSIARGRNLQSLYMLNGMREHVISLACLRHGLPPDQGRGVDELPEPIKEQLRQTIVASIGTDELLRAFTLLAEILAVAIDAENGHQAERLLPVLAEIVHTSRNITP